MSKPLLVYIPGLGSGPLSRIERWFVAQWFKRGRDVVFFESQWHQDESYADKYNRLSNFITGLSSDSIYIVGISAGGSLAVRLINDGLAAYAYIISGALKGAEAIGGPFRKRAPALYDSIKTSETIVDSQTLDPKLFTIYRPLFDGIIRIKNMVIPGAVQRIIPAIGHPIGIAVALVLYFPRIIRRML